MPALLTPPATPKRSNSASWASKSAPTAREPLPLDLLIPAGTLRLHDVLALNAANRLSRDEWLTFAADSFALCEPPLPSPASSGPTVPHLLHDLVAALQSCRFEAVFQYDEQLRIAILRTYLVPSDDQRLWKLATYRSRKARASAASWLRVLQSISTDEAAWNHGLFGPSSSHCSLLEEPRKTLLEVYQHIASPHQEGTWVNSLDCTEKIKDRIHDALSSSPAGFASSLFPYQQASLAKMLARELAPQLRRDPSFQLYRSVLTSNSCAYWMSTVGEVRRSPPRLVEPKGGILAEEMGTGKTAICLALVVSTLGEVPTTAAHLPMTSLALDFPFVRYDEERQRLKRKVPEPLVGYEPTALEEAEYGAALRKQEEAERHQRELPLPTLKSLLLNTVKSIGPPVPQHDLQLDRSGLLGELEALVPFYYIHPSPDQLSSREGRRGQLPSRRIVLSPATLVVVPSLLVKQWQDEIEKHVESGRPHEQAKPTVRTIVLRTTRDPFPSPEALSRCDLVLMSSARFSDAADDPKSCIRDVHWKRAIIDEGHTLGSGSSRMQKLAEQLLCECRWAVTGTPSTNMRGSIGEGEGMLFAMEAAAGGDFNDFERLGRIYFRFLKHSAFPKPKDWRELFAEPMLANGRGSTRIQRLFDDSIVRTQPDHVKRMLALPPMQTQVVYLKMGPLERKTYNSLLALFAVNSVLSQRTDLDYLFHKAQRKHLDVLATNLSASTFYFSSDEFLMRMFDARDMSRKALEGERSDSWSDEDKATVRKAIDVFSEALDDPSWLALLRSGSAGLDTVGLTQNLKTTFGAIKSPEDVEETLTPTSGLAYLRRAVKELRYADRSSWKDDEELEEEIVSLETKRKWLEINPKAVLPGTEEEQKQKKKRKASELSDLRLLPAYSPLRDIRLGTSTSTKLNYVIQKLSAHADDKFIIFTSTLPDLTFAVLSETLDLLGIPHAILAGPTKGKDRGSSAAWFNNSTAAECRAILVDAKLGGRGLNLIAANRVLMLAPIWSVDLEVQAAKRAHRLGQTKPCYMEILVIEDSYEHEMLKRRSQLTQTALSATKAPQADEKLKDVLQSAMYLPPAEDSSLIRLEPVPLFKNDIFEQVNEADASAVEVLVALGGGTPATPPPSVKKMKKSVAFA